MLKELVTTRISPDERAALLAIVRERNSVEGATPSYLSYVIRDAIRTYIKACAIRRSSCCTLPSGDRAA